MKKDIKMSEIKGGVAFEIRREIIHVLTGFAIICLVLLFGSRAMWMLFFALIFGMAVSLVSLNHKIPFFNYMIEKFEREKYKGRFPGKGMLFFVAGSLLVLKLFSSNQEIALAAIAILTAGDSASHLFGLTNEKKEGGFIKKSMTSTAIGMLAAFIAGSIFIAPLVALVGAVVAMIAENFSVRIGLEEVDDNITVPIIAGTIMYLMMKILA